MDRAQCEALVKGPGKFEGEQPYVPYFWTFYLDGMADDDTDGLLRFDVTDLDRTLWPELGDKVAVYLRERDDGFVVEESDEQDGGLTDEDLSWLRQNHDEMMEPPDDHDENEPYWPDGPDVVMTSIGYVELWADGDVVSGGVRIANILE